MRTVTVVIPTWDEATNITPLLSRLDQTLRNWHATILFVDDSLNTDTIDTIDAAKIRYSSPNFQVSSIRRTGVLAWGGLAGAVTDGLRCASSPIAVVMDADLQHPPELLPSLLLTLDSGYDLVIGSRYCKGGDSTGLGSPVRHVVSRGSTYVAKALFPKSLRGVTDPMTGFYAIRLETIDVQALQPSGFKILLETLIRHRHLSVTEVPMQFASRNSGASKAGFSRGTEYLQQLLRLRISSWKRSNLPILIRNSSSNIAA